MKIQIPATVALLAGAKSVGDKDGTKELKKEAKEKEKAKKAKMKSSSDFDDLIGELSNICEDDEYYSERKTVLYELAKLMKDNKYNDTNAYKKWKDFVDDVAKERKKLYKEDYPQKVCQEVAKDMTKEYKTYAKDKMKLYSHIHANVEKEILIHI